jgi:flagellar protein FliL
MSAKPAEEAAPAEKPKSKKMLIIIVAVVLVLVIAGGGAAFFLMKKKPAEGEGAEGEQAAAEKPKPAVVAKPKLDPKAPPVYLPMDNLVVNLADPGGGRFAQLGITLQLDEQKTADLVKQHMPSVRNAVLLAASKRTADEMLAPAGKEKLARSITNLVSATLGYDVDDEEEEEEPPTAKKKKKKVQIALPVVAVLFTSFIVQ